MNALRFEKSPYLLQHADNPVDWRPWGEEAFARARETGRPIFLSIGYSTCHWCHVMEHESFRDTEVASLMNETFVSIKVDREERPDVDSHYMTACQLMTGSGGWPLTIVMTPEGTPFFAGTYIPKETAYGRVGMLDFVPRIRELWATRRDELVSSAQTVAAALAEAAAGSAQAEPFQPGAPGNAAEELAARFDFEHGGFGSAPKFPMAEVYPLLLRAWHRDHDSQALRMVELGLHAMRNGGVYDQVGFGFHRYSTDPAWRVPHFEKMLYDQALLCIAYVDAWRATGNDFYRRTAEEICAYVMRDMRSPEGGFYTAEDADSEGQEGKYYLWTRAELETALSADELQQFSRIYRTEGDGELILFRDPAESAAPGRIEEVLRRKRERRQRPSRDDKILTDWNGLMIAAFARAGAAFDAPPLNAAAARAADFLLTRSVGADGRLLHRFRDGEAAITGFADDSVFLCWGLLELYEATFETRWLGEALRRMDEAIERFWDRDGGGFFQTADDAPRVPGQRTRHVIDGVIPSANSAGLYVLTKLAEVTGRENYRVLAESVVRLYPKEAQSNGISFAFFLSALDLFLGPSSQVVIAGVPEDPETHAMVRQLRRLYLPNVSLVFRPAGERDPEIARIAPFAASQVPVNGRTTAYVCRGWACELPTNDPAVMLKSLGASGGSFVSG
ncbi:MAG TPA: thioredoxin domain-containing protein [Spirochaetia bacterium]|nr:thioredoxin domain-containing protein [Spirochaetia bacterium]